MNKEINKETKKQIEELKEVLLSLKLEGDIKPNDIRILQQQLDKLIEKMDKK
tara:strand:+ start:844 stop:999 length:156 start_codon:yes stop_codon:yes gene_type:complete